MAHSIGLITPRVATFSPLGSNPPSLAREISAFQSASKTAFQAAFEFGRRFTEIQQLVALLNDPSTKYFSFYTFAQLLGSDICKKVCCAVALGITNKEDAFVGENLLKQDFRVLHRIKNSDGKHPLETYLDHVASLRDTYTSLGFLNHLAALLVSLESAKQAAKTAPFASHQQASDLHNDALNAFRNLPEKARAALCEELWKIDGKPSIWDYGYNTALQNIEKLYAHNHSCLIRDCIVQLEQERNPMYTFTLAVVHPETILGSDSEEIVQNIYCIYQLRDLALLFKAPSSNLILVAKYEKLSSYLKELLHQIVSIASYQPPHFTEHTLRGNVRWLAKTKNEQGLSVVEQLISHYSEKIKSCGLEAELTQFMRIEPNKESLLGAFRSLSSTLKENLKYKVWYEHGGKNDARFRYGDGDYGGDKIKEDPFYLGTHINVPYKKELQTKRAQSDHVLLQKLKESRSVPEAPIDVSTDKLQKEAGLIHNLPEKFRIAVVTAEYEPAGMGGLKSAVIGMVKSFGEKDVRVIMPLYRNGPIKDEYLKAMREKTKYAVFAEGRQLKVQKLKLGDVRCYLIDDPKVFWIPKKPDGISAGNFYEGSYHDVRRRWIIFSEAAARLCSLFKNIRLIHCHEAQTGPVIEFSKIHHPEEWERGETPVTVFTYHNTAEPLEFKEEDKESLAMLERAGLPKRGTNSFIGALQGADVVTTVSKQFGEESQTPIREFSNGMEYSIRRAAHEGKLFGVVNGNTIDWDPRVHAGLLWTSVLPETRGTKVDLRYGPHMDIPILANILKQIQMQLCTYLGQLDPRDPAYVKLDPQKPIVMFVGRYETRQKGIYKLTTIMEETLRNNAQFVCVGVEPDDVAKETLRWMKKRAGDCNHNGVLILEDNKIDGKLQYQGVFGAMLRAASTLGIFPSCYEPCGLVQGEFNCFGKKVVAPKTGGFVDTLKPGFNGYLFKRLPVWDSWEQGTEIENTLRVALQDAWAMQRALYHGTLEEITPHIRQMQDIMKNALASTWESTPDGSLSPARLIELVYAKGFQRLALRGGAGQSNLATFTT